MNDRLTRRTFLLGAAGALGVAACSKGNGVIQVPANGAAQLNLLVSSGAADGPNDQAVSVFESGIDQRVAFILAGKSGPLAPTPGSVTVQFSANDKTWGPTVPVEVHADTGASATAYATTTYRFPQPGTYWVRATMQGQTAEAPVVVIDRSAAKVPYAGQKMISTPTPTESDHRGVNPICTRASDCGLHTQSLDMALTSPRHMPVALLFATPALCTSATCGPVLDTLLAASAPYSAKITFIHCEIFTALSRNSANTAPVLAYNLQSEPVLFLADGGGTVVQRIDGLFGKSEIAAALAHLASL